MTEAIATRVELIEEATALETAKGMWSTAHTCAVLGCHRSTLYRQKWLMERSVKQPGGIAFHPADVRVFQANNTGLAHRQRVHAARAR